MIGKRTISRLSLPDVIANDIRERILNGELNEGELIRQEALASEYAVSRMPVREALKQLDAEGLVQLTNNRGASVTKHSLREIAEIFDLRKLIEVDMFCRAIPKMTSENFEVCQILLDEMEASYDADDIAKWGGLNFQYHSALYAAADRTLTNELLSKVNLHADRYVRMHLSMNDWQRETAKEEHRMLLMFAKDRKVEEARALLTEHIIVTKEHLLDLISTKRVTEAN